MVPVRARSVPWALVRWVLATLLAVWVLASAVFTEFTPVRLKLVRTPLSGRDGLSVPLDGADRIKDARLVLICRVRNEGTAPLAVSLGVAGQVLKQASIAPRSSSRLDVSWARPFRVPAGYRVEVGAASETWSVEYLELANLHGFTRGGALTLLFLPADQPFDGPPRWWMAVLIGCGLLLLFAGRPAPWPRGLHAVWLLLSAGFVLMFLIAVVSAAVSPYNVVLSPGTFAFGLLVLAAPRVAALARRVIWPPVQPAATRLAALPWFGVVATLGLAAYALFLAEHVCAVAGASDSSGYMNSARLLGAARVATPMRTVAGIAPEELPPYAYVPLGFRPHGDRDLTPTYPIGLPVALLLTARVTGWELAPGVVMVLHAVLGLFLVYRLARVAALPRGWAALGTLVLSTSPLYLFMSLSLMSDVPAMAWSAAAVLLAWRSRREARWSVAAGAALAIAVLVRPTNLLILAPVAVAIGASFTRWALLAAGGAPGAALLVLYNLRAYGHPLSTGYGDTSALFTLANLPLSAAAYAAWLPAVLTPAVVLAGGLPFLVRRSPRLVTMLLVWIGAYGAVYSFYYYTHEDWWFLRFLLPAFPPLIAGALLVARALLDRWPARMRPRWDGAGTDVRVAALAVAALLIACNLTWDARLNVRSGADGERLYPEVATWTRDHLPAGAAVAAMQASGALFYHTDLPLLRWDSFRRESFARVQAALAARGQPLYAVLFPYEIAETGALSGALTRHLPGSWTQVGSVGQITIWHFGGVSTP